MASYPSLTHDPVIAQLLAELDDDALAALLAARPDLADPAPLSLAALQQRAVNWHSVITCIQRLDRGCQQVVQALILLPAGASVAELTQLLGPDVGPADVEPALERLTKLALLSRDRGLRLAEAARQVRYPAGLGPAWEELTGRLRVEDLRAIAEHLDAPKPTRKAELAASVRTELTRPGRVQEVLADAPEAVKELALALAAGPPVLEVPYYGFHGYHREVTPIEWLRSRGMLIAPNYGLGLMPQEVAIALRGGRIFPDLDLTAPPSEVHPVNPDAVESRAVGAIREIVEGLTRLLEELEQRPGALLKSGAVGIREVRRAATVLGVDETAAARALELAAAAGLLGRGDGRLLVTAGYDTWRDAETSARWATLVTAWLAVPRLLSVAGSLDVNGKPVPPMLGHAPHPHAQLVRRQVLTTVADPVEGTAFAVPALVAALRWAAPGTWQDDGEVVDLLGELDLLGLAVDGVASRVGRALVTGGLPQAQQLLSGMLPPLSRTFVLQADLTAIASGELAPEVRRELELMADRESSGGASVYRFSPSSLRRALDVGRDSAALLDFLREHAVRGVPQPLEYLIGDLGRRFGQLRVRAVGCYLRSEDTALLAELPRVRALASLGLARIAPTVVAATASAPTVMAALRAEGYLPAAEGADGQPQLQRPVPLRAAATPAKATVAAPDFPALVARLRAGAPEEPAVQLALVRDDEPVRPTFRGEDRPTMLGLLGLAIEQEWAVGLTLEGPEVLVLPWELVDDVLYGEAVESGEELELAVAHLAGVRILDSDEELRSLIGV